MSEEHGLTTATILDMALSTELSNKASTELNLEFYTHKIASGKELDMAELNDKEFWEKNLVKIQEKIEFLNGKIAANGV
jgi:hypothetical protein